MTREQLAAMIDHTLVRAYSTQVDIAELCDEAVQHGFANVSVNPTWTAYCAKRLEGAKVGVNACVGFPLGASTAHIKVEETKEAIQNGATEIDVVINIGALKSGFPRYVGQELAAIVHEAGAIPVKVILEAGYLSSEEKRMVCVLSMRAGAAFVKTSTGYGETGATVEDVILMRETVGSTMRIKAAGGIRSYSAAIALIEAGATRIGTSAGIDILAQHAAAQATLQPD